MNNYPTIRQLQYLDALHKTNNFGRAAELCFVTQPTLSSAIKELEKTIGIDVIDRSKVKQIKLTPYGLSLIQTAQNIFKELDKSLQDALERQKPLSGRFRLGVIPTIAPYMLPHILPLLQKQFPDMQFEITENMSANLIKTLNEGNLDLIIMAFPYETPNIQQESLFEEPFDCAAPDNVFKNKSIRLEDLNDHQILLLEDGHCLRDHALAACKLQKSEDKNMLKAASLLTLTQMVGQGYGLTLLPKMALENNIIPSNVTLHTFKSPAPKRKIGFSWIEGTALNNNIEAIRHFLKSALK